VWRDDEFFDDRREAIDECCKLAKAAPRRPTVDGSGGEKGQAELARRIYGG